MRSAHRSGGIRRTAALAIAALIAVTSIVVGPTPLTASGPKVPGGGVVRVSVPEAIGGKTVLGQLTVDNASGHGYVTAYPCRAGLPRDRSGAVSRSDLNYNGRVAPVWSNRLIVQADDQGDVCFYTLWAVDLIIDINAVSFDSGISSFENRRTDTRTGGGPRRPAGDVIRLRVPEAAGGKTVIGQLTVDRVTDPGYLTAYGCADGIPRDSRGRVARSDLNFDGWVSPAWSNRLIVQADAAGEICIFTLRAAHLVIDINGVADIGIESFPNRRVDTRDDPARRLAAGDVLELSIPEAAGRRTVIGQLTADRVDGSGFATAYGCADGIPRDANRRIARSDLNFDGNVSPAQSNRLVVQADAAGQVCVYAHRAVDLIVDINGVSEVGILSFANRRTDTRSGTPVPIFPTPPGASGVPVWPMYEPLPPVNGVAALTGLPASTSLTRRPILAVKIDNFRLARPQWGLDRADVVFEENVEGVTRFIALFHTHLPTDVGPVRSARTADLDVLTAMNRPVFGYSGANSGVTEWIASAASSGVLVDFSALRRPCYRRSPERPGPHNLVLDAACAIATATTAGPARALWGIDPNWVPGPGANASTNRQFRVPMDGVLVDWTWDASAGRYLRSQDGAEHRAASGARISAHNVVVLETQHPPSVVDARSPHPITTGTGRGVVHRNGRSIEVTWSRPTTLDGFTFLEVATGAVVPLNRGTTFVELTRAR